MSKFSNIKRGLVASLVTVAAAAQAAVPSEIATTQTDALAVGVALTSLAIAVWGSLYIKRKFFGA